MPKRDGLVRGVGLILATVFMVAQPARSAAPRQAQDPKPSPPPDQILAAQPTSGGRIPPVGPTSATVFPLTAPPTNTLEPPPAGGGRVAVDALYVRDQPNFDSNIIGLVGYGTAVFPVGRNANTTWIAINWGDGLGWLYKDFIVWDSASGLEGLSVLAPANTTPFPSDTPVPGTITATEATPSPSATPSQSATNTPEPTASASPRPAPSATDTQLPPSATPTEVAAVVPAQPPAQNMLDTLPSEVKTGGGIGLGLIVLGGILYLMQRAVSNRELARYRSGFALSLCPVCLEGRIHLDEVVKQSFGMPRVSRSARCDNCRSVLRQVKPGEWRYSVDSYANPDFAKKYGKRNLNDEELQKLAEEATEGRFQLELEREQTLKSQMDLSWLEVSYDDSPVDETGNGDSGSSQEDEVQPDEEG